MAQQRVGESELFIVEDDTTIREMLSRYFTLEGFYVTSFADGTSFLAVTDERAPACVLLDIGIPGVSGLDILKRLNARKYPAPIFMISGYHDVPIVVDAIKYGAFDFFEKPFDLADVAGRVRMAIASWAGLNEVVGSLSPNFSGRSLLTPRELVVLGHIASGASNKESGRRLGISPRTIEVHRARIMNKLGARNAADLVRIVLR
ncbi:MAG: response regulator transcription factor [Rhizobiales bacterium]|nr:response regulator transcription factor [Hyphomicrobiales bacterium]